MQETVIDIQSLTKARYILRPGSDDSHIYIFLHGFSENAEVMLKRFVRRFPSTATLLSVGAPYPYPKIVNDEWQVGFSWFFYDSKKDHYFVGYDICKNYMRNLIDHLGFTDHPKTLIGFSQGGYASVHMAQALNNVPQIIGLGSQFVIDPQQWTSSAVANAVHGTNDDAVSIERAKRFFAKIPERNRGQFKEFTGAHHAPTGEMLDLVTQWALEGPRNA